MKERKNEVNSPNEASGRIELLKTKCWLVAFRWKGVKHQWVESSAISSLWVDFSSLKLISKSIGSWRSGRLGKSCRGSLQKGTLAVAVKVTVNHSRSLPCHKKMWWQCTKRNPLVDSTRYRLFRPQWRTWLSFRLRWENTWPNNTEIVELFRAFIGKRLNAEILLPQHKFSTRRMEINLRALCAYRNMLAILISSHHLLPFCPSRYRTWSWG